MTEIVSNYFLKLKKKFSALKLEQSILATKPILSFCIILLTVLTLKSLQLTYSYFTNPENVWGASCYAGRSALFDGSTGYLSRTFTATGDRTKWTKSYWVKKVSMSTAVQTILQGYQNSSNRAELGFSSATYPSTAWYNGSVPQMVTSGVFRDPTTWDHFVFVYDSNNATSSDRIRIYVNGTRQAISVSTNPTLGFEDYINGAWLHYIGRADSGSFFYSNLYLSNMYFIDGQALAPTAFATTSATSGKWVPAEYTGTYGTNGFHLNFANSLALGADVSGNGNHWTVNGGVTASNDHPNTNLATLNPLDFAGSMSNGNLRHAPTANTPTYFRAVTTQAHSDGKYYVEFSSNGSTDSYNVGLVAANKYNGQRTGLFTVVEPGSVVGSNDGMTWATWAGGQVVSRGGVNVVSGIPALAVNATGMLAWDQATGNFWVGVSGVWYNSGNPATGANPTGTLTAGQPYLFEVDQTQTTRLITVNFGQATFAYSLPIGFTSLSGSGVPTPTVTDPTTLFRVVTWTGTGGALNSQYRIARAIRGSLILSSSSGQMRRQIGGGTIRREGRRIITDLTR